MQPSGKKSKTRNNTWSVDSGKSVFQEVDLMPENLPKRTAAVLWGLWQAGEAIADLPEDCKPGNESEGQNAQIYFPELAQDTLRGWKIAATSSGGQNHINVSHPLEGPYLASKTHDSGTTLSMTGNNMAVAEAEFAFVFGRSLPSRNEPYSQEEILDSVDSLVPSLEFPDSRILNYRDAGAAGLLADCACARDCVLGPATTEDWKNINLAECEVQLIVNDEVVTSGTGADALESPLVALEWVVNQLSARGIAIETGQFITTGVCGLPSPIRSGDRVTSDLGRFGTATATLVD